MPFADDWGLPEAFYLGGDDLRLVFLPNPNSPSGTVIPPDVILDLAERLPCPLLVDEAYVDFAESDCVDLVRRCERVMVSRTLSKSYALAGLRFGYLVAQPQLIQRFAKVKDSYNCDALSIAGATAAIDDQAWLTENVAKIRITREWMTRQLGELGFEVIPSQANFVWCKHSETPAKTLYERLKAAGILVRYMEYPDWQDGLRISVGTEEQTGACLSLLGGMV